MRRYRPLICLMLLLAGGCASLGCEVQPLQPKSALRCEMPIG